MSILNIAEADAQTPPALPPEVKPSPSPAASSPAGDGMRRCLTIFLPEIERSKAALQEGAEALARDFSHAPFDPAHIVRILTPPQIQQIFMMAARVMVLELNVARLEDKLAGDTPEERFVSFVDRLSDPLVAASLCEEYPVLVEQVANRLQKWTVFSLEFLRHLCEDWESLRDFFRSEPGLLVTIDGGMGDTHCGGRSVLIATFSSGSKLVYKPRSLSVDQHFQQLLIWLNSKGMNPPFRPTQILSRVDHGWSEFVSSGTCRTEKEIADFYERQGCYLAVLYALNAVDFHYENLIADGAHPILIDLETLFHTGVRTFTDNRDPGVSGLWSSVAGTGLLPMRVFANERQAGVDISGMTNPSGQLSPGAALVLERTATDEMHMVRRQVEMPGARNCPTLNGQEVNALEHASNIVKGFASAYRLLMRDSAALTELLHQFADDETRFIARATRTYGTLLMESFHPDLLRDGAERMAHFERLRKATSYQPFLERLVAHECRDLVAGDIPLFHSRPCSRDIWTSDGQCIPNVLPECPLVLAERRVATLSENDLERQLWVIGASLATLPWDPEKLPKQRNVSSLKRDSPKQGSADQFVGRAMAVGERLAQLAHREGDKANWIGLVAVDEHRRHISPSAHDLYDGLPGIVLFLAYLSTITKEDRYLDLAHCGLRALQAQLDSLEPSWLGIGGYTGVGGLIYALCHLSAIWEDTALAEMAERLLEDAAKAIESDNHIDIISGSAGFAMALRSLGEIRPSKKVIELQRACGERLLETASRREQGIGWVSPNYTAPLTGFAHGNAGVACALMTIAAATAEHRFWEAAESAIAYERAVFSPANQNWPDLRAPSGDIYGTAWCHGAPGIGLARLCSPATLGNPQIADEIEIALNTTVAKGFGKTHIICHGDLGNVDILLHASRVLRKPTRWKQIAYDQATYILNSAPGGEWRFENTVNVDPPGLMTGLAGIGYVLLRLADASRVPCVLALEPPKAPRQEQ
jgi:type 2 lantibiotic biosynthesis protein LanM